MHLTFLAPQQMIVIREMTSIVLPAGMLKVKVKFDCVSLWRKVLDCVTKIHMTFFVTRFFFFLLQYIVKVPAVTKDSSSTMRSLSRSDFQVTVFLDRLDEMEQKSKRMNLPVYAQNCARKLGR